MARNRAALLVAIALTALALGTAPAAAQQQKITRTVLQKSDVPGTNYETVLALAEFAPDAVNPLHTHPGTVSSYVLAGSLTVEIRGQPTLTVAAGQSMFVPANTPHVERSGPAGAKTLAVFVVEKGKPLATLVK